MRRFVDWKLSWLAVFAFSAVLYGCGGSGNGTKDLLEDYYDGDLDSLLDDTYNQGWFDALDCVERHGGSARSAADYCEDR